MFSYQFPFIKYRNLSYSIIDFVLVYSVSKLVVCCLQFFLVINEHAPGNRGLCWWPGSYAWDRLFQFMRSFNEYFHVMGIVINVPSYAPDYVYG